MQYMVDLFVAVDYDCVVVVVVDHHRNKAGCLMLATVVHELLEREGLLE